MRKILDLTEPRNKDGSANKKKRKNVPIEKLEENIQRGFVFVQTNTDELVGQTTKPEAVEDVAILSSLPEERRHSRELRRVVAAKKFTREQKINMDAVCVSPVAILAGSSISKHRLEAERLKDAQ